jgi:hypothetical protein
LSTTGRVQFDNSYFEQGAAKLTHIGPQTGPVNTVVAHVLDSLPPMSLFRRFEEGGPSYNNDELPTLLTFSVTQAEFRRMLEIAARLWENERNRCGDPSLSFTAVAETAGGPQGTQLLFNYEGGVALHRALPSALEPGNVAGKNALQRQRAAYSPS